MSTTVINKLRLALTLGLAALTLAAAPPRLAGPRTALGKPSPVRISGRQEKGGGKSAADERGTFRVTLLGFVVNHETRDTLLETDGKRDEVYQVPVVLFYDRDRGLERRAFSVNGPVYGDTNNHPTYVRAGSAHAEGGLRTGDHFPAKRPWEGTTPAGPSARARP